MGNDDPGSDDVEFLDVGPARRSGDGGAAVRRRPRWLPLLVAAIFAAILITRIVHRNNAPSAAPSTQPTTAGRASLTPPVPTPTPAASSALPAVITQVGHRLLGVTGRWELLGRSDAMVFRIQLARGRITRTPVPELQSSGAVSFVVGADEAIVRPIDYVPGYVVPDGRPARRLDGVLGQGGPVFPGPDLKHVWVASGTGHHVVMKLVALNGSSAAVSMPVPSGGSPLDGVPDGTGYVMFPGAGGYYDARPDGLHPITAGALLAIGPTTWLALECHNQHPCATVDIDRASGARHVVRAPLAGAPLGVISPDAATAAVFQVGPTGTVRLDLLNLSSGHLRRVALPIDQAVTDGTIVWSPDSRWLLAVGANGKVYAVDPRTGRDSELAIPLPPIRQLAIRSVPRSA